MLNIWRLKLLVQFQTLGTMQRVSEMMHTSIAAVSQQLNLLEKETNLILFEKVGRRMQLTPEGQSLVNKIRPVLNQLESIENSLTDTSEEVQGTVRIAVFTSALEKVVIPAVSQLSQLYPKLQIRLTEMEPDISLPALDAYQFDLAIVAYSEKPHLLEQSHRKVIKLGHDRLRVLVSDKNPIAKQSHIGIESLKAQNWVLEPDGTYLCEYTKNLCRSAGYEPNVINVVQSYLSMHSMIAQDLAIGILPTLAIIESIQGIHMIDLQPEPTRDIYLVARKNTTTTRAMKIVMDTLCHRCQSIVDLCHE
ncbi:LysR family transcriptional regulator [Celerinatantimonas sp. YJH-8]|uniref:LysR family transcriptional regulator n=1 Tax=Celerinatantimonas sp. YJH-8 TaxID=3228714 RepID=UPI0038C6C86F